MVMEAVTKGLLENPLYDPVQSAFYVVCTAQCEHELKALLGPVFSLLSYTFVPKKPVHINNAGVLAYATEYCYCPRGLRGPFQL